MQSKITNFVSNFKSAFCVNLMLYQSIDCESISILFFEIVLSCVNPFLDSFLFMVGCFGQKKPFGDLTIYRLRGIIFTFRRATYQRATSEDACGSGLECQSPAPARRKYTTQKFSLRLWADRNDIVFCSVICE